MASALATNSTYYLPSARHPRAVVRFAEPALFHGTTLLMKCNSIWTAVLITKVNHELAAISAFLATGGSLAGFQTLGNALQSTATNLTTAIHIALAYLLAFGALTWLVRSQTAITLHC